MKKSLGRFSRGSGGSMERKTLSTMVAASLLVILAAASVSAGGPAKITAKVPFAFSVGGKSLPEGDYTFYQRTDWVVEILGPTGKSFVSRVLPGTSEVRDGEVKITFHRYDDQYFVSEVFDGTGRTGLKFPVSRQEKEKLTAALHSPAAYPGQSEVAVLGTR
jgi:hypothetical protein